jgi:hypothetical protein
MRISAGALGVGIVTGGGHVVDEGDDGLVVMEPGQGVLLQLPEVLAEVGAQVVVAHAVVDEHLVVGPFVGPERPVAGGHQEAGQKQRE